MEVAGNCKQSNECTASKNTRFLFSNSANIRFQKRTLSYNTNFSGSQTTNLSSGYKFNTRKVLHSA
jgi:hypothetical protein